MKNEHISLMKYTNYYFSFFGRDINEKNTENKNENLKLAGRVYQVEDYQQNDQLSSGLATTHEQVSDAYVESATDSLIGDVNGKNSEIVPENLKEI